MLEQTIRRGLAATLALSVLCGVAVAQQRADVPVPRFDVVSVKPCDPDADPGTGRGGGPPSPDGLYIPCMTVRGLIGLAFFSGQSPRGDNRLAGGPDWISSARYTIEAVAPGVPLNATPRASMLQRILTERFSLRIRREPRAVSAYALMVARGGSLLEPLRDGDCVQEQSPQPPRPRKPTCDLLKRAATEAPVTLSRLLERSQQAWIERRGNDRIYNAFPVTMDVFATFLDSILDRPVGNGTMLQGLFDVRLEFSPEGTIPPVDRAVLSADPPRAASIFTALQEQLGLRLEPGKATAEVIVIESLGRPAPN